MGSGKSDILCRHTIICMAGVPDNQGVIGRFTHQDFKRTTLRTLQEIFNENPGLIRRELPQGEGWEINTTDPDKPSTLWTAHFDKTGPYASMALGLFAIDEVNGDSLSPSVPEAVFRMLAARLGRQKNVKHPYGLLCGNPGGHNWVWKRFSPDSPEHHLYPDHAWFKPQPFENEKNLPESYYQHLMVNGKEWAQRYVYGSDDVFEGQVYPELNERDHARPPHDIPPEWPRIIVLDHGNRNPTAILYCAIDFDGRIIVYDELYEAGKPISYHAKRIKERNAREDNFDKAQAVDWIADPAIFHKGTMQKAGKFFSVFDEYSDQGLSEWTPGENDSKAGRNRVKELLAGDGLKIMKRRCPNLWRELTQLRWKKLRTLMQQDKNPPEEEQDHDNHTCDCLRYAVMSRPEAAFRKIIPKPTTRKKWRRVRTRSLYQRAAASQRPNQHSKPEDYV
jgi:hypothetical protein